MSVKIMGLVWDLDIPRDEKFVLLAYTDHANHDGTGIYPAVATIAQKTGYSERSVQEITRRLVAQGLLIADGKGPQGTNKWRYGGVQKLRGAEIAGVQNDAGGGAEFTGEGVQPTAPEPSLTVHKPSSRHPEKKGDAIDGMIAYAQTAEAKLEAEMHGIAIRLSVGLRRGEFPETPSAQSVYKWVIRRERDGQSLDRFIAWAMDGKRAEFSFIYHKDPALIKRDWAQVFDAPKKQSSDRVPETLRRDV